MHRTQSTNARREHRGRARYPSKELGDSDEHDRNSYRDQEKSVAFFTRHFFPFFERLD